MTDAEGAVRMSTRKMKDSGVAWIREIPEDWSLIRLKFVCEIGVDSGLFDPATGRYIGLENVESFGGYKETETKYASAIYAKCYKEDVLYSKLRPYLCKCIFAPFDGYCTGEFLDFRAFAGDKRFLRYWLLSPGVTEAINASTYGCKMPRASDSYILNMPIVSPDIGSQRRIAAYLDDRCARIDSVIETTKKTIEDYKALKQSIIFEAVTGKNVGGKMKDSGVEWIGKVPAGWSVRRVKHIAAIRNGSDPVTEGDVPVYGSGETSFKTCGEYKEGPTVLLGRKGATLHIPHYIEGRYWNVDTAFDVKMKEGSCLKWFYYLAISFDYEYYISQTTLPGMTQTNYNNMRIPVPPQIEQFQIADDLDKKCATIDSLIAEKLALIADLEAYKKSLIFECVTGKCEVA